MGAQRGAQLFKLAGRHGSKLAFFDALVEPLPSKVVGRNISRQRLGLRQPSAAFSCAQWKFDFTSSHADSIVKCMPEPKTPWPHAPTHQLSGQGTYFVTVSTYQKAHHFHGAKRLRVLHRGLLSVAGKFGWQFEAWAVFSNHYHFIAHFAR